MHEKFFELDKTEIEEQLSSEGNIYVVRKNVTIIEKCKKSSHKLADLIIQYGEDLKPSLIVERIWRQDCSLLRWVFIWLESMIKGFKLNDKTLDNSYCFNSEYVDIAIYKRSWFEWLKELLGV